MFVRIVLILLLLRCLAANGQSSPGSFTAVSYSGELDKLMLLDFERTVIKPARSAIQLQQLAKLWQSRNQRPQFRVSILGPENSNFVYIQSNHLGYSLKNMAVTRGITFEATEALACVFSDTLLVPDTLLIMPQGIHQSDQFRLRAGKFTYILPRNRYNEILLTASQFPEVVRGRHTVASIDRLTNGHIEATWTCSLYLLSTDEQKALSELITTCYVSSQVSCTKAISELSQYLRGVRGDKYCSLTAAYDSALRNSLRRFALANTTLCR